MLRALILLPLTLMPIMQKVLLGAAFLALSTASLSAQVAETAPAPDSTRVTKLATVTVSAESGNRFTRADDMRKGVLFLIEENRRLTRELREHDAKVEALSTKLDSLQKVEAAQQVAIATINDAVSETRARRRALEARLLAAEIRQPQP